MNQSLSYSSSCISEFFDAREYGTDPDADSDEDSEEGETGISDSEDETDEDNQVSQSVALHMVIFYSTTYFFAAVRRGQLLLPRSGLWCQGCDRRGRLADAACRSGVRDTLQETTGRCWQGRQGRIALFTPLRRFQANQDDW